MIAATAPPQSDALQHAPHVLSGQQYGRPVSALSWHCVFEQHSRHPTPGQHVVPLVHALTYSHAPFALHRTV
jgi:hypothetical protein